MGKSIYSANYECFVRVLGRMRLDSGISQGALAKKMKMKDSTMSDIFHGQRRVDVIEWLQLCKFCKITPEKFLAELEYLTKQERRAAEGGPDTPH